MIIFFQLLLLTISSFAFNNERCNSLLKKPLPGIKITSFLTTSSSQYVSSTGECAALGKNEQARQEFYVINFDKIRTDFAKGGGEYASAFLSLSYCFEHENEDLFKNLQKDCKNVSDDIEASYSEAVLIVESRCKKGT